jgi:predicted ATPase
LAEPLSSFVGRQRELDELVELLTKTRLLTLTGPGGVGKTRLALRLAQAVLDEYPAGVYVVELAALTEPGLLPQAVAQSVGVPEQGGRSLLETLASVLGTRSSLLLLDNCEHLIAASASLVASLLSAGPCLRILVTSREPLGVAGEVTWPVPVLPAVEAAQLFQERALAVDPSFALSDRNAIAVAEVCRRLDGLPLAIELAAARARVLSPEELVVRLEDRFAVLVAGSRSAPPRHQTLRAAVDWSYDLLEEHERGFFDCLSVFAGSFTLAAAESVCLFASESHGRGARALDLLAGLVDRSLVLVDRPGDAAESRYRVLETLRAYGRERLAARRDWDVLQQRHALWTRIGG